MNESNPGAPRIASVVQGTPVPFAVEPEQCPTLNRALRERVPVDVETGGIAAEPGGATAFAALLSGAYERVPGEKVAVVICGGTADPASFA